MGVSTLVIGMFVTGCANSLLQVGAKVGAHGQIKVSRHGMRRALRATRVSPGFRAAGGLDPREKLMAGLADAQVGRGERSLTVACL